MFEELETSLTILPNVCRRSKRCSTWRYLVFRRLKVFFWIVCSILKSATTVSQVFCVRFQTETACFVELICEEPANSTACELPSFPRSCIQMINALVAVCERFQGEGIGSAMAGRIPAEREEPRAPDSHAPPWASNG